MFAVRCSFAPSTIARMVVPYRGNNFQNGRRKECLVVEVLGFWKFSLLGGNVSFQVIYCFGGTSFSASLYSPGIVNSTAGRCVEFHQKSENELLPFVTMQTARKHFQKLLFICSIFGIEN